MNFLEEDLVADRQALWHSHNCELFPSPFASYGFPPTEHHLNHPVLR
jgi:hypothetical protein